MGHEFESGRSMLNHLGLFAKFWQPGTVKTRLATSIGDQIACDLYRAFVFHLINRLRDSADQRTVVFSPREREPDFRKSIPDSWKLCPQSSGDLGKRMSAFFRDQLDIEPQFRQSCPLSPKVVVIGADCPQIGPELVWSAFESLDKVPVVIGPSHDGGYYLIGMRQEYVEIFAGIEWSTESVFSSTVQRLNELDINFETLAPLTDVDDYESLFALRREMEYRKRENGMLQGQSFAAFDEMDHALLNEIQLATARPIVESE